MDTRIWTIYLFSTTHPGCLADETSIVLLPDGDGARTALLVNDGGWHHHIQVAGHGDHGVRVDLAHVVALVLGLDILDLECPRVVTVMDHVEPGNSRDNVLANCQNHLSVNVDPSHLKYCKDC